MAPIKRRPHTRSHPRMKLHPPKPTIIELVYKFLRNPTKKQPDSTLNNCSAVSNSKNSCRNSGRRNMSKKQGKNKAKNTKSRGRKLHPARSQHHLSSCMHSSYHDLKTVKKYIQNALDFGVESGYLIPNDSSFRTLRVSSQLMEDDSPKNKVRTRERTASRERDRSPRRNATSDDVTQEPYNRKRRRSTRPRSRSTSRRRRRRSTKRAGKRKRSQNPDEVGESDDVYEVENEESVIQDEDGDQDSENAPTNVIDDQKTVKQEEDERSDVSVDDEEDETDEDQETKKGEETSKS